MEQNKEKQRRLSKKAFQEWLGKIYQVLESEKCEIILKKLRRDAGECVKDSDGTCQIKINPYMPDFFDTVIHEALHAIDLQIPHKEVYWLSERIVKRMTPDHYIKLIILLAKKLAKHLDS